MKRIQFTSSIILILLSSVAVSLSFKQFSVSETSNSGSKNNVKREGNQNSLIDNLRNGFETGISDVIDERIDLSRNLNTRSLTALSPENLQEFLESQINYIKDNVDELYINDDNEKPQLINLNMPDLNLMNVLMKIEEAITFVLYDKNGGTENFDYLKIDDESSLKKSRLNTKRPTVFITHGFISSMNSSSVKLLRDAYLKTKDYNIIAVNWSPLSGGSYVIARLKVPAVGESIGKMINFLMKHGLDPKTITLIGHSLGAHVMGFAGKTTDQPVKYIIGLDPAWPLFAFLPESERISNNDASYVQIIHTNSGLLGSPEVLGDFDFYPNGGSIQRGCENAERVSSCCHSRSFKYLAEHIAGVKPNFNAIKCESYLKFTEDQCNNNDRRMVIMGDEITDDTAKGVYYLDTKASEPFGLGTQLRFQA